MDEKTANAVYTKEDFINGSAPFEEVYALRENPLEFLQAKERMTSVAKACGVSGFKTLFKAYCETVKMADDGSFAGNASSFENQPIEIETGQWCADDNGISRINKYGFEEIACVHPIMPVHRYTDIDTGIEKLVIAFRRDEEWRTVMCERGQIASANKIVDLANKGIAVTSENAKSLVQYLSDAENLNLKRIPANKSVGRMGWIGDDFFSPYVDGLIYDGDENYKYLYEAIGNKGKYEDWVNFVKEIRAEGNIPTKMILAASFASVLVKPCNRLPFFMHLWGGSGNGKDQPLSTRIITPYGSTTMGEIKVGDQVIGQDGKPHCVIGVYPQGKRQVYEITFKDGTKTRSSKTHLWDVITRTRKNHGRGFKTMTLEEIMEHPIKTKKGYEFSIPVTSPVEYAGKELPIDPYLLGVMIGDGCMTSLNSFSLSNTETDVLEKASLALSHCGFELHKIAGHACQFGICGEGKKQFYEKFARLGLNVRSDQKFIPREYLVADVSSRKRLLRGLFDTDGNVAPNGSCKFSTASSQLSEDFAELCRSLGYRPRTRVNDRRGGKYMTGDKEYVRKSREYIVTIPTNDEIFTSEKHRSNSLRARQRRSKQQCADLLPIVDIQPCGEEETQCIMVDSDDHTYLCDDYIVTHNTVSLMLAASVWGNPAVGEYINTFNSTSVGQEQLAGFFNSMPLIFDEMQIQTSDNRKDFDSMIYQLTEGVGRIRGAKEGGIRNRKTWRNCILTSGEQPIMTSKSGGGATNRVIEIDTGGIRFFKDAKNVADFLVGCYGHAGKVFIDKLMEPGNIDMAKKLQGDLFEQMYKEGVTEKQALAGSLILAADALTDAFIFNDGNGLALGDVKQFLAKNSDVNVGKRAYEWLCEWLAQNSKKFEKSDNNIETWGKKTVGSVYIIRSVYDKACNENGYNPTVALMWLRDNGLIETEGKALTKRTRINGTKCQCVVLKDVDPEIDGFQEMSKEYEIPW